MNGFRMVSVYCLVCQLLSAFLVAGCVSHANRSNVSGTVTFDGDPLADGTITFVALSPENQGSAAKIEEGRYSIRGERGLADGEYRVEVSALRETGKSITNPDEPGSMMPERVQYIPLRYNQRTELKATVSSSSRKFDFELTSD
jgi:hypothetical protein